MAQVGLGCGTAVLVRARSCDDPSISLLLDNGVTGIILPDVNSAAEAKRAVDACKFAPIGKRSVAGGYPNFDCRPVPLSHSVRALNESTLVVCMIETREGLGNVEEIAAVCRRRRGACGLQSTCWPPWASPGGLRGIRSVVAAVERVIAVATRRPASSPGLRRTSATSKRSARVHHEGRPLRDHPDRHGFPDGRGGAAHRANSQGHAVGHTSTLSSRPRFV